nr:PREDICTED: uncharacterized protein LOC109033557 [Bemisia tabaci]
MSQDDNTNHASTSASERNYRASFDVASCPSMVFEGDLSTQWKTWKIDFDLFMLSANLTQEGDPGKNALLVRCMGKPALSIFKSFDVDVNSVKHTELVAKFDAHFSPKVNVTVERLTLFSRKQKPNESLKDFLTSLKNLSINCQFSNLKNSITKDLFIGNLNVENQNIKEELIKSEESSLDKIFALAQKLQLAKERSEILNKQVDALNNSQHHQPMSQPSRSRYRR